MVCYAFNLLPIKENLFQTFKVKNPTPKANKLLTIGIVVLSTSCAWLYKEVTAWLQLVGSFAGVALAFTIPALSFYIGYRKKKGFESKAKLIAFWGIIVTSVGLSASLVLVLDMAKIVDIKD